VVSRERINRLDASGRKQGLWKFFHENGLVQLEGNYSNDLKDGYFKEYDENGKLLAYQRCLPPGQSYPDASAIGRVVVLPPGVVCRQDQPQFLPQRIFVICFSLISTVTRDTGEADHHLSNPSRYNPAHAIPTRTICGTRTSLVPGPGMQDAAGTAAEDNG